MANASLRSRQYDQSRFTVRHFVARKPWFKSSETSCLVRLFEKYKVILLNQSNTLAANKAKSQCWDNITQMVNKVGQVNRSVAEVRKRWKDLLSRARKDYKLTEGAKHARTPAPPLAEHSETIWRIYGPLLNIDRHEVYICDQKPRLRLRGGGGYAAESSTEEISSSSLRKFDDSLDDEDMKRSSESLNKTGQDRPDSKGSVRSRSPQPSPNTTLISNNRKTYTRTPLAARNRDRDSSDPCEAKKSQQHTDDAEELLDEPYFDDPKDFDDTVAKEYEDDDEMQYEVCSYGDSEGGQDYQEDAEQPVDPMEAEICAMKKELLVCEIEKTRLEKTKYEKEIQKLEIENENLALEKEKLELELAVLKKRLQASTAVPAKSFEAKASQTSS